MTDMNDIKKVGERLRDATNALHGLVDQVALSRQIKEFSSDQRKNALAEAMAPLLREGMGVAAAEATARASDGYKAKIASYGNDYRSAEATIAKWQATNATFDALRSVYAMTRETVNKFQG